MSEISPALLGALRLFVDELKKHVEFIDGILLAKVRPPEIFAKEMRALEARFHTIKGGAGFLQLSGLQRVSGDAESFLKSKPSEESFRRFIENDLPVIRQEIEDARLVSLQKLEAS